MDQRTDQPYIRDPTFINLLDFIAYLKQIASSLS